MRDVVIVEAVRSAIGKRSGSLAGMRPDELLGRVLSELMRRSGVDPRLVEDIIVGCVTQVGEQGWNIGRLAGLVAGLPVTVPATSVNRMCGSGQQAVHFASQGIAAGDLELAIAAGVESMSRVKMGSDGSGFSDALLKRFDLIWQGQSAEMLSKRYNLSRTDLDEFSLGSHQKALAAIEAGAFRDEIVPVDVTTNCQPVYFSQDEGPRADTSLAALGSLKTAFAADGVITAGNSSQISDGASAVLLASADKARELGLKARARIVARTVVGSDPIIMLDGVIPATQKVLERAGLCAKDIDCFEINEAFACVPLAWAKEIKPDMERVNPCGGAIALGHPLGASGARLMGTMLGQLERQDGQFGLQVMCIGHGMSTATIIERLP